MSNSAHPDDCFCLECFRAKAEANGALRFELGPGISGNFLADPSFSGDWQLLQWDGDQDLSEAAAQAIEECAGTIQGIQEGVIWNPPSFRPRSIDVEFDSEQDIEFNYSQEEVGRLQEAFDIVHGQREALRKAVFKKHEEAKLYKERCKHLEERLSRTLWALEKAKRAGL